MIDSLISYSIKNKVVIGALTLLLVVYGIYFITKLPIDAVSDISNNQVQIVT